MATFNTACDDIGARVDVYLARALGLSRSAAARLIANGAVKLNDCTVTKSYIINGGEIFEVKVPEPEPYEARPQAIELDILYEDSDLLVINKPRGLVVHPGAGHTDGTLVNALLYHCGDSLSGIGGVLRPGIVHRLDKDSSGLMLAAKNDAAHNTLSGALSRHEISRVYEAVVRGCPEPEEGIINAPIGRDPANRKRFRVRPDGKRAVTSYKLIESYRGWSHMCFELETGRTHQIRVHSAHKGHPLLGDKLYGGIVYHGFSGQCLHACKLRFTHPATGKEMRFTAECPEYFEEILRLVGRE